MTQDKSQSENINTISKFQKDSPDYPEKISEKKSTIISMSGKLQSLTRRNQDTKHINSQIYHILLSPFTLDNAYTNLSKNKGAFTQGVNTGTVQGYSRTQTLKLVQQLKDETYTPSPILRTWIPKPGKKEKRPLGIPTFQDKVIQEAVRGILESIYEPEFREFAEKAKIVNNFGFRPQLGCWDAINHFTNYGQRITYVIEGDIKGAYDNVNFEVLMEILSKRIKDKKFLKLIRKMLNAGIMDEGRYEHSLIGVPQGGVLSPLLFNIYMFELDKFIYEKIIPKYSNFTTKTTPKNKSKLYQRILYSKKVALKEYNLAKERAINDKSYESKLAIKKSLQNLQQKEKLLLSTPSYDRPTDHPIVYTRYADDWILGVGSNEEMTKEILSEIDQWLSSNLKLTLSPTKTKITNIRRSFVPFLGYEMILRSQLRRIKITKLISFKSDGTRELTKRRTTSSKFFVRPNKDKIYKKLKLLEIVRKSDLYPIGKRSWASLDEYQIVQKYHSMFIGLLQHYRKCNTLVPLNRVSYIFLYSCAKTIAVRLKVTMPQVFSKYGKYLTITKQYKDSLKIRTIEFMGLTRILKEYPAKNQVLSPYFDPFKVRTFWRTTFKLYSQCCICGSSENIEMHHLKSLKSIKQSNKEKKSFNNILKQLNRKQISVCHKCHTSITHGSYDGKKLSDLYDQSLAAL